MRRPRHVPTETKGAETNSDRRTASEGGYHRGAREENRAARHVCTHQAREGKPGKLRLN